MSLHPSLSTGSERWKRSVDAWSLVEVPRAERWPRRTAEIVITLTGVALVAGALAANQRWLDRHFLPSFFLLRSWYVLIETCVRVAIGTLGVALVLVARFAAARLTARRLLRTLQIAIAAVLALGASEVVLRRVHLGPAEWLIAEQEPLRRPDPRLGWTFVPARTGHSRVGGRTVEYAFDAAGYRVRRVDEPVDPERPTILFSGESVMFGEGLTWEESIPAQVGAMMGVQSANLAVHGFGSDLAYLRLEMELPRFRRPVAVVSLFMTALFGRNLNHERPHLAPGLVWRPAVQRWRLESLARFLVPYHSEDVIEDGVTMTREVLHATADLVQARGAAPLIVVPQFGREEQPEQLLRHRILDKTGLPYVLVEIDPAWHLPWDRHPSVRGAHVIAAAVAARLRGVKGALIQFHRRGGEPPA
jgi:hypothetical protein